MDFDPNACPPSDAGIFGLPFEPKQAALTLLPVPWEATTSYRPGTAKGPAAIRAASHQLDLFDVELGEPWRAGIAMLPEPHGIAELDRVARRDAERVIAVGGRVAGDAGLAAALERVNAAGARLNDAVALAVDAELSAGRRVGVVGGDHAVPFGAIQRLADENPGLGILHLDAHADLREAYEGFTWSHASIMFNVITRLPKVGKLVQVGIRDLCKQEMDVVSENKSRIATHFDAHLVARKQRGDSWSAIADDVIRDLPAKVYLSWDVDGLDPQYCPHTGTPVPGGLSYHEACALLRKVVESGRTIVGLDLVEVAPGPEGDEWDANVGARLLYKMCGWMLKSRK